MKAALIKLISLIFLTACTNFSEGNYLGGNEYTSGQEHGDNYKEIQGEENKYLSEISSNLVQSGIVCEGNDVIYYYDSNDECINSIDKKGYGKEKIIDVRATNLFYHKGKLYFRNFLPDKYRADLCSVNIDGTDYRVIKEGVKNTFYIYDDILYYNSLDFSLYAYDVNSKSHSLLMDQLGPEILGSLIYKNKIYYYSGREGVYGNVLEHDFINKTEKVHPVEGGSYLTFYDEGLYFDSNDYISRYNINTEENTQIFNVRQNNIATEFISITKDYIFFTGQELNSQGNLIMGIDINGMEKNTYKLYRINHDGSKFMTIYENDVEKFNIIDDRIFVTNNIDYSKKKDGTYLKVIDFDGKELGWDI